jgi:hypothetical protein
MTLNNVGTIKVQLLLHCVTLMLQRMGFNAYACIIFIFNTGLWLVAGVLCLTNVSNEGDADISVRTCSCSRMLYSVKVDGTLDMPTLWCSLFQLLCCKMHVNLCFTLCVPNTHLLERWVDSRPDLGKSDRETNPCASCLFVLYFNTLRTDLSGCWERQN